MDTQLNEEIQKIIDQMIFNIVVILKYTTCSITGWTTKKNFFYVIWFEGIDERELAFK